MTLSSGEEINYFKEKFNFKFINLSGVKFTIGDRVLLGRCQVEASNIEGYPIRRLLI